MTTCLHFARLLVFSFPAHSKIGEERNKFYPWTSVCRESLWLSLTWAWRVNVHCHTELSSLPRACFQKPFPPVTLPASSHPLHSNNCDMPVSGLAFHTSYQGPHLGWLQFSEAWQLVNRKARDVNHGLRQFPVGVLLSSHQILSFLHMKRSPVFPSDTNVNIDQRETEWGRVWAESRRDPSQDT